MLLPTSGGYALHPELGVDWDQFQLLIDGGEQEDLGKALALVRGEPMEDCHYWWLNGAALEGIRARVTEVAEHLAITELYHGRPDRAIWAISQGLLADPHAETLYQLLMRAEAECGNTYGIHQTYQRWVRRLDETGTVPAPLTSTLYRELVERASDGLDAVACRQAASSVGATPMCEPVKA
jgi:two-component SAPR family response regulator